MLLSGCSFIHASNSSPHCIASVATFGLVHVRCRGFSIVLADLKYAAFGVNDIDRGFGSSYVTTALAYARSEALVG
jgi:hypothetical protein